MKALFTAACVLTCCLGNEMPAKANTHFPQAPHVMRLKQHQQRLVNHWQTPRVTHRNTVVQPQTKVCRHVPARYAGFIQVGNKVEHMNVGPRVECAWQNDAHRTITNTVTTY